MKESLRQHPLFIFHAFSKYILLLMLPLLRALVLVGGNFVEWFSGFWFDILILLIVVATGILQWYFTTYIIEEKRVHCRSGFWIRKEREIGFGALSSVSLEHPFYLRPFRVVRVRLETDAGSRSEPDIALLLSKKIARRILEDTTLHLVGGERVARSYQPKSAYIALLSLITSNTLTGVIFAATFISQAGKLLGAEFEERLLSSLTKIARLVVSWLPPVAGILALIVLGGWALSFLVNLVNHLGFQAVRKGGRLSVKAGLLTQKECAMTVNRINYLMLRQSLTTRLFGFYVAMINCTGYGKEKNELAVLLPAVDEQDLRNSLKLVLPEIHPSYRRYKPPFRTITRFLIPPLTTILCIAGAFGLAWFFLKSFRDLTLFLGMMALIPAVWWLFVKLYAFFHVGIGIHDETYTFRTTFAYAIYTTVVPRDKIAKVIVRQSLFQKMANCSDVLIYFHSEKKKMVNVQNVAQSGVEEFLRTLE